MPEKVRFQALSLNILHLPLFTKLIPTVNLDMIYWSHEVVCVLDLVDLHFTLKWPWLGRNGEVYKTVPMDATFTKLTPTVHFDMIYWYHVVVCGLDLYFCLQPWVCMVKEEMFKSICATFTRLQLFILKWFTSLRQVVVCDLDLHFTLKWP